MELEAKETRMVILALQKMLDEMLEKISALSDEDDEYVFLTNDATMIGSMIAAFKNEYRGKYDQTAF